MRAFRPGIWIVLLLSIPKLAYSQAQSGFRPAMMMSSRDSVAAHLHYPQKAEAARAQAAIPFYCEVGADGTPAHIQLYGQKDKTEFRIALLAGLAKGRFQPALAGGKPVPVILGGTTFFMFRGNEPTIAICLSTADKEKTAGLANYIQPQMLVSHADFCRKLWRARFDPDLHLQTGVHPGAIALAQVDSHGNLVSTKITAESPANAGWGALLLKGFKGAKFIPALSNGKPVAGQFDLIVNFEYIYNPDDARMIGSRRWLEDSEIPMPGGSSLAAPYQR